MASVGGNAILLLYCPVHRSISNCERGNDEERLSLEAAPAIEDGGMKCAGERLLAIGRQRVGDYAFLRL